MRIMAAPTGARRSKADHPAIPITIPEMVTCASDCFAAGADAFHLHVRNPDGSHSIDPGLYREAMSEMARVVPKMAVQVTTESGGIFDVAQQFATLKTLQPKCSTVSLREAARDMALAERLYRQCTDQGTDIQHIIFDTQDALILADWQRKQVLPEDANVILVLGRYTANMNSDPSELDPLLASLPPIGDWMLCAFGPNEHACLNKAATLGGDVRVGFENSYVQADGRPWPDMPSSIRALIATTGDPNV